MTLAEGCFEYDQLITWNSNSTANASNARVVACETKLGLEDSLSIRRSCCNGQVLEFYLSDFKCFLSVHRAVLWGAIGYEIELLSPQRKD